MVLLPNKFSYQYDFLLFDSFRTESKQPYNPYNTKILIMTCYRFRLFPVRSPLLWESRLIYFP